MAKTKDGKKFIRVGEYWRDGSLVRGHIRSTPNVYRRNSDDKISIFKLIFNSILIILKLLIDMLLTVFMVVINFFIFLWNIAKIPLIILFCILLIYIIYLFFN